MSESVEYEIDAKGFKDSGERDEFQKLCESFQDGEFEAAGQKNEAYYTIERGWRGGGLTCEKLLEEAFKKWLDAHPHVSMTAHCRYLSQVPVEIIEVDNGKWKNLGVI